MGAAAQPHCSPFPEPRLTSPFPAVGEPERRHHRATTSPAFGAGALPAARCPWTRSPGASRWLSSLPAHKVGRAGALAGRWALGAGGAGRQPGPAQPGRAQGAGFAWAARATRFFHSSTKMTRLRIPHKTTPK